MASLLEFLVRGRNQSIACTLRRSSVPPQPSRLSFAEIKMLEETVVRCTNTERTDRTKKGE